jgi:hypothetical protein
MATVVRGRATDIEKGSDFSYAATTNGPMAIKDQIAAFRVDNKPVVFRTRTFPSIKEGDEVVAAGSIKNGTLHAIALRNASTGANYSPPLTMAIVLASLLAVLGLMSLGIGLGYIILPIAAFVFFRIYTVSQAAAAVKT